MAEKIPSNDYAEQKSGNKGDSTGSPAVIPAAKCGANTKGHGIQEKTMTPSQGEYRPQVSGNRGG